MSNHVFVLDTNRKPLTPCKPGVARSLLNAGKASVFRRYPFTIILNKEVDANPEPLELKLDPGSKVSGMALKQGERIIRDVLSGLPDGLNRLLRQAKSPL